MYYLNNYNPNNPDYPKEEGNLEKQIANQIGKRFMVTRQKKESHKCPEIFFVEIVSLNGDGICYEDLQNSCYLPIQAEDKLFSLREF